MTLNEACRYIERVLAVWCAFFDDHSKFETACRTLLAAAKPIIKDDD